MDRREFLSWVGVGSVASFLPVAIAACRAQDPQSSTQSPDAQNVEGFQPVGTVNQFDPSGQLLNEEAAVGPVLVVRDAANPDTVLAVNPTCTHAGCTVAWNGEQQAFVCPCHGSRYAPDGSVVQGPATESLALYTAKIEQDQVLVQAN